MICKRMNTVMRWPGMTLSLVHLLVLILTLDVTPVTATDPKFDPTTRMRLVLVPADAQVGSVIYRIRATDEEFDYPLQFEMVGDSASSTVQIETLPCTKYNSICQANVILKRRLEAGRYYDFQISVKDTKGNTAMQSCSITATNFTTPHDMIFPHKPAIIMVPEDAKRGTELNYVIARKNPLFQKPVYLELWGSPLFGIRQKIVTPEMTEGTIFLLGPLDFEKQSMYHLSILANDAYAEPGQDSRNVAGVEVVVIVGDVQDVPPIFTLAPPVTKLSPGLLPGDKILKVEAEDGDKGVPREIRYGLVSENNPFTSFFNINDTTGEIFLMRPLDEIAAITHIGDPVLLTVVAEEVKVTRDEPPAMATTVQLAFLLPERENSPPYFENDHYVVRLDENSPQGTALQFNDPYVPRVYDDDTGKNGVFSLTLLNNNGTFEITPNVAERRANFLIRVRDSAMLDYEENDSVQFQILAQELGPATNLSAIVNVTVFINDVNDNPPVFSQPSYSAELPENMTTGTRVVQVHAEDKDTGSGGRVRYTSILGYLNTSLNLDADSGLITISTDNHGFDREQMAEYHFYVEARDDDGSGNVAQVPFVLKVTDVNDEMPVFEKSLYEFVLTVDLRNFTSPAFIRANDGDAEPPNNVVRYEIVHGNYDNKVKLNEVTGQLTLRAPLLKMDPMDANSVTEYSLRVRAFDLGAPVQFSEAVVRIYPPESRARTIQFVVPNYDYSNPKKTEDVLEEITGGKVTVMSVKPFTGREEGTVVGVDSGSGKERSVVTASVLYDSSSVVDIAKIQQRLLNKNYTMGILTHDDDVTLAAHKAESRLLFWILIFLALLIALLILTLLLCCICSWCPLYGVTRKRVIRVSSTEDDVHLVHRDKGLNKESKSVQVAEWMGRREAWSADRTGDTRTKPTHWEFQQARGDDHKEKLDEHRMRLDEENHQTSHVEMEDELVDEKRSNRTTKAKRTGKHLKVHNSRTNLINDRDVYVEDVEEDDEDDYDRVDGDKKGIRYHHIHHHHHNGAASEGRRSQMAAMPVDDDSMRRAEMDRGSDIGYERRGSLKRQQAAVGDESDPVTGRDQLFIKDGNAEILRLITRGKKDEENIYVNVPQMPQQQQHQHQQHQQAVPQYIMLDNGGKEILMRRYIEEQSNGKHVIREHYQVVPGPTYIQSMPNEVQMQQEAYVQKSNPASHIGGVTFPEQNIPMDATMVNANSHHSLIQQELENSLKQQNALLRQILLEKEKLEEQRYQQNEQMAMETQSLPPPISSFAIATQTDCEAGTQTEPPPTAETSAKPTRRRARSENDDSDSDGDFEYVRYSPPNSPSGVYWMKRRKSKGKRAQEKPKRMVMVEAVKRRLKTPIQEECEDQRGVTPKKSYHRPAAKKADGKSRTRSESPLNKRILVEISDSLDEQIIPNIQNKKKYFSRTYLTAEPAPSGGSGGNKKRFSRSRNNEEEESSGNEIIVKHYSADSLDEQSDIEEDQIRVTKRAEPKKKPYPPPANNEEEEVEEEDTATVDPNEALDQISDIIAKSRPSSRLDVPQSAHYSEDGRKSRRDEYEPSSPRSRRQTASEPPQSRASKAPITKGDGEKGRRSTKEKTQSESELLKRLEEEGGGVAEIAKTVPKYMEWYYNKNKDAGDSTRAEKMRAKAAAAAAATAAAAASGKKSVGDAKQTKGKKQAPRGPGDDKSSFKPEPMPRRTTPPKEARMLKEDIAKAKSIDQKKQQAMDDGSHSLLQHSEHRFEGEYKKAPPINPHPPSKLPHYMYPETPPHVNRETKINVQQLRAAQSPIKEDEEKHSKSKVVSYSTGSMEQKQLNASTLEDDHDSGIAMNSLLHSMGKRNKMVDKKSIFTIAYDEVKVNKIRSESDGSPLT